MQIEHDERIFEWKDQPASKTFVYVVLDKGLLWLLKDPRCRYCLEGLKVGDLVIRSGSKWYHSRCFSKSTRRHTCDVDL